MQLPPTQLTMLHIDHLAKFGVPEVHCLHVPESPTSKGSDFFFAAAEVRKKSSFFVNKTHTTVSPFMSENEYVLYVGSDRSDMTRFCRGSRAAVAIIDSGGIEECVSVQSVQLLKQKNGTLPVWLVGTPTLVCRSTKKAFRGQKVIDELQRAVAEKQSQKKESESGGGGGGEDGWGMTLASDAQHIGIESNWETVPDAPGRYDDKKITDNDVQQYMERRKQAMQ